MKKLNKFFAVLVALAMMATLCVSMAFAESGTTSTGVKWADGNDAKLVKYLQAGNGVDLPAATYNFKISPKADNPATVAEFQTTIELAAADKDANGDYLKAKSIADVFAGKTFDKAGEYKFDVTELDPTYTAGANEELIKDNDTITLHIYVKNTETGTAIDKVTAEDSTGKLDPTVVGPTADQGKDKGVSFTNTYKKNIVVDPEDDKNGALDVTKSVVGDYADKTYEWSFKVDFTKPEANQGAVKYKVLKKDGTVKVAEKEATAAIEETLADGEKIVITQMPQGTTWSVTENTSNATVQNADKYVSKIGEKTLTGKGILKTDDAILSERTDATVENTLPNDDVTPTGILLNNLPYIVLALVAIGGLCAYVIVRRKNADEA